MSTFGWDYIELSRHLPGESWNLPLHHSMSHHFRHSGVENPAAARGLKRKSKSRLDSFTQINKSDDEPGEAGQSGNSVVATAVAVF